MLDPAIEIPSPANMQRVGHRESQVVCGPPALSKTFFLEGHADIGSQTGDAVGARLRPSHTPFDG